MSSNRRVRRMQRKHQRHKAKTAINLVSLMDIFTILVFFLLVNATEVEVLPNPKALTLPESVSETRSRERVVVMVTPDSILLDGKTISDTQKPLKTNAPSIDALERALSALKPEKTRINSDVEYLVTIMGDKDTPYRLLKKIMLSCTRAGFESVALAVIQKPPAS